MIWLQEFGSNSPASELNRELLPEGSGHQVRCSVQLHPRLSPRSWSTCTAPGRLFGLGVGRAGTSAPQRWGSASLDVPLTELSTEGSVWRCSAGTYTLPWD